MQTSFIRTHTLHYDRRLSPSRDRRRADFTDSRVRRIRAPLKIPTSVHNTPEGKNLGLALVDLIFANNKSPPARRSATGRYRRYTRLFSPSFPRFPSRTRTVSKWIIQRPFRYHRLSTVKDFRSRPRRDIDTRAPRGAFGTREDVYHHHHVSADGFESLRDETRISPALLDGVKGQRGAAGEETRLRTTRVNFRRSSAPGIDFRLVIHRGRRLSGSGTGGRKVDNSLQVDARMRAYPAWISAPFTATRGFSLSFSFSVSLSLFLSRILAAACAICLRLPTTTITFRVEPR